MNKISVLYYYAKWLVLCVSVIHAWGVVWRLQLRGVLRQGRRGGGWGSRLRYFLLIDLRPSKYIINKKKWKCILKKSLIYNTGSWNNSILASRQFLSFDCVFMSFIYLICPCIEYANCQSFCVLLSFLWF